MDPVTYMPGDILKETCGEVKRAVGATLDHITVERTVIGLFFTGVKLDSGAGGLCFTPVKTIPEAVCCPSSAAVMPASGRLGGRKAVRFLDEMMSGNPLKKTMGIAVLNALSAMVWSEKGHGAYTITTGADTLEETAIPEEGFVVVVGALVPALRVLKRRDRPFGILELDRSTLKQDELPFLIPPEKADQAVSEADLLIITGTTLINDTLEGLLGARKESARVVVVGPTASMIPDAFFRRGVGALGGVMVTDADRVLNVIAEAGSGYHFFGKGAERVTIHRRETD